MPALTRFADLAPSAEATAMSRWTFDLLPRQWRQLLWRRQWVKCPLELDPRLPPKQWRGVRQQRSDLSVRLGLFGVRLVYHYEVVTRGD